jgi:hypothetical protein
MMSDSKRLYSLARWFCWGAVIVSGSAGIKTDQMSSLEI